jgi:hypothetical protein
VKRLISEVESRNGTVLDELYERCGYYMSSLKVVKYFALRAGCGMSKSAIAYLNYDWYAFCFLLG